MGQLIINARRHATSKRLASRRGRGEWVDLDHDDDDGSLWSVGQSAGRVGLHVVN